jgi:hypothetical protein
VRIAGLEPAKALFSMLPSSGAISVSLPFITHRLSNNTFCLQALFGNQWQLLAKNLVQILCKNPACAKTVQIQCRREICAKVVQTF